MIALLVVALSVSMAAAIPENVVVTPPNQYMDPNQDPTNAGSTFATYTTTVTDIPSDNANAGTHTMYANTTLIVTGAGSLTDLRFRFHHAGESSSGWLSAMSPYIWHDTPIGAVSDGAGGWVTQDVLTMDVMDTGTAEDCKYQFEVHDSVPLPEGTGSDSAHGTSYGTSIPEFAAIAIPVLALLGLVLYMRRKKD